MSWKILYCKEFNNFCKKDITEFINLKYKNQKMGIRKIKNQIGKKIKNLRIENDLSQEQLAEFVGMSREHISCLERGKNLVTIESLYKISEYFKIDIRDFF